MSTPKRQHFIPKSYLRNFADINGEKEFVEVLNVNTGKLIYPFSLSNVCVSKNLYTLPHVDNENKYLVEHYYAEHVDGVYPDVYRLLTDTDVLHITEEQRIRILNVCLSLYFRNAKFLDEKNEELNSCINRLKQFEDNSDEAKLSMQFGGRNYEFKKNEIEKVKETVVVNNRVDFILSHLEDWQNFVRFKNNSQITVNKIVGEVKLITSDNPVRISSPRTENFNLFNPNNCIQLPLDQNHLLWISPNDKQVERDQIYRGVRDKWFSITSNHSMQCDASEWIIGKKGCVSKYLEEDKKYNTFDPENVEALDDIKLLATEMNKLLELAKASGGMTSELALQRISELKDFSAFAKDPQFQTMCAGLMAEGFLS
jgi:hypothetical protein